MPIGMATFPNTIPIFFGQNTFEGSIHDADFEDNMEEIYPIHLKWAKLVKEHITQQENNGDNVSSIIKCLTKKPSSKKVDNATYATVGTTEAYFPESVFFFVFSLNNQEKWKLHQDKLCNFFVGNPSPTRNPQPSSPIPLSSPMHGASFQPPINSPPVVRPPPGASVSATTSLLPAFDPVLFLQQLSNNLHVPQQPQTIVVESRADKTRKSKAKFNNNMLQLLLIGGNVDIITPGSFVNPCIPIYTQAMKNIIVQPALVQPTHVVNILTRVFGEVPNDLAQMLSPLTTHKSMHHISKILHLQSWAATFRGRTLIL
jgi:hypothetical protein